MLPPSLPLMALIAMGSLSRQTGAFVTPNAGAVAGASITAARRGTTRSQTLPSARQSPERPFESSAVSFSPYRHTSGGRAGHTSTLRMSTAEAQEAPVVSAGSDDTGAETQAPVDIPTSLPSDSGIDYVPLATMLATGDLKGADQFTRDALIKAAGAGSQKRDFVYWTEVKKIPNTDMATMENLWLKYSKSKFGYSVQKDLWRKTKGDFENFCRRIGWTTQDSEVERKLRWFGANEFIYDVDKAPRGHLPLTSALRGTTLLKELMQHPVWETEWQWE